MRKVINKENIRQIIRGLFKKAILSLLCHLESIEKIRKTHAKSVIGTNMAL